MSKLKEFFDSMSETVTVTKLDGTLTVVVATLAGVIIGMLISPRKNMKVGCGNGSGNEVVHNWGDDESYWEEDEIEDENGCLSFK